VNLHVTTDACNPNELVDDLFVLDHDESEQLSIVGRVSAELVHLALSRDDSVQRNTGMPCRLRVVGHIETCRKITLH
jgi:hypothetical protein